MQSDWTMQRNDVTQFNEFDFLLMNKMKTFQKLACPHKLLLVLN